MIIKNNLTQVILLYLKNPFIKHFFFQKKFIEMLLNNDILKIICSYDFTLSKRNKCNYVHY